MAAKNPKDKPEATEEQTVIDREVFDWGVRLVARPFRGTANQSVTISAEIRNFRAGRGSEVFITFPAASMQRPLRVLDAQIWHTALGAIIAAARAVQTEMRKTASKKG